MDRRLLDVNAYTTLDVLEASARGGDWTDDTVAVLDVETPDGEDRVSLRLELDPGDLEHVDHHADRVDLTHDQARTLAEALQDAAGPAE